MIDLFDVYAVPTADILSIDVTRGSNLGCGTWNTTGNVDTCTQEIGKVVHMIIKGNVNYLVGVMSDIVVYQNDDFLDVLRKDVVEHGQTKACVPSIRGLAEHNYRKYIVGSDTARDYDIEKKCGVINRTLLFGINILEGNGFHFIEAVDKTPASVRRMMSEFEEAVELSDLPEKTDPSVFRNYLLAVRLYDIKELLNI